MAKSKSQKREDALRNVILSIYRNHRSRWGVPQEFFSAWATKRQNSVVEAKNLIRLMPAHLAGYYSNALEQARSGERPFEVMEK